MANPLAGLNTSAAWWRLVKERGAKMRAKRPANVIYCPWCDCELKAGAAGRGSSLHQHQMSKKHVDIVLAAVRAAGPDAALPPVPAAPATNP